MRVDRSLNVRRKKAHQVIRSCIAAANDPSEGPRGFRLVHYSVQKDHLHLIVEAKDRRSLSRGMQGLTIRLARRLNALWQRRGKVFTDRYHAVQLTSPRQVRHVLEYVLCNHRRHAYKRSGKLLPKTHLDPYSSAPHFGHWRGPTTLISPPGEAVTAAPRGWLLGVGWKRYGRLDPNAVPGVIG